MQSSSPSPPSPPSFGILSQAAVSIQQVEENDALLQVTDQIALETVAVAVPTEFVERLNEELAKIGQEEQEGAGSAAHRRGWSLASEDLIISAGEDTHTQRSRGCSIDFGAIQGELLFNHPNDAHQPTIMNLQASTLEFVNAITEPSVDASTILPTAEEILQESNIDVKTDLDEPDVATATAVLAAPLGGTAVVAEIISGEMAEQVDIVEAAVVSEAGDATLIPAAAAASNATVGTSATDTALPTVEEGCLPSQAEYVVAVPPGQQPVSFILAHHPVWIAKGGVPTAEEIDQSIHHLDNLIIALKSVQKELYEEGLSPGFETKTSTKPWRNKQTSRVYQTLPSVNAHSATGPAIPVPSPAAAVRYYLSIRETWVERKRYVEAVSRAKEDGDAFCSCIRDWDHAEGDVLALLSHQSLEQDMIREASDAVTVRMSQPGYMRGEAWDRLYQPETCPTPESQGHLYTPKTAIRVIGGRDDYIATLTSLALSAESTVEIATCYLFPHDPAQRYLLLDLLPYVARKGLNVRLLVDMMPVESSILKSALKAREKIIEDAIGGAAPKKEAKSRFPPTSFLDRLPENAPNFSKEARDAGSLSPMDFIAKVLATAFAVPDGKFEVRWWCARDSQELYRVKNHAKCAVFDGKATVGKARGMALMGGSNLCPTLESGDSDLDLLVAASDAVNRIGETFEFLWESMCDAAGVTSTEIILDTLERVTGDDDNDDEPDKAGKFPKQEWLDKACRVALVRSEPCSAGSDAIFRHVLGAIASARESIIMCMGHSNKPMSMARALGEAVKRGVRVQILVNSIFSCDLRVNQRDLFRSIRNLLTIAPGVEVYTTALRSHRTKAKRSSLAQSVPAAEEKKEELPSPEDGSDAPPFLHSKYTVVDHKWTAVGSWNVWTRSAFYEIEHELLIESQAVATRLEEKFEKEKEATSILLTTPEECAYWCPTGCKLCMPFGPFYV